MGPYRTIWDHTGPYGALQKLTGSYITVRDHNGPGQFFQVYGAVSNLTHSLTHRYDFVEGHALLKKSF